MTKPVQLLLVNPWITDFAAYNLWAEPLGLLYVAAHLAEAGARVRFVDLTGDGVHDPSPKPDGRSRFRRRPVQTPAGLEFMDREYALYGLSEQEAADALLGGAAGPPDAVLVTSMMTYWYPGVRRTIRLVRELFGPGIPVILGGVYARLLPDHARAASGADEVYTGANPDNLIPLVERLTGKLFPDSIFGRARASGGPEPLKTDRFPHPLHGLRRGHRFFTVISSFGCPFRCTYCASSVLGGPYRARSPESVCEEVETAMRELNTSNLAFYDDALLYRAREHFLPLLSALQERGLRSAIHLPNGVHARFINGRVAAALKQAGVETIRLGLEFADASLQNGTGSKTTSSEYRSAVSTLREAGFTRKQIGTYVLAGIPGQTAVQVRATMDLVRSAGGAPILSYFSPIPGTLLWDESVRSTHFPVEREPLLHNNTVFIRTQEGFSEENIQELKNEAARIRDLL